jgi:hypothetical protein
VLVGLRRSGRERGCSRAEPPRRARRPTVAKILASSSDTMSKQPDRGHLGQLQDSRELLAYDPAPVDSNERLHYPALQTASSPQNPSSTEQNCSQQGLRAGATEQTAPRSQEAVSVLGDNEGHGRYQPSVDADSVAESCGMTSRMRNCCGMFLASIASVLQCCGWAAWWP